jgi:cytochrome c
MRVPLAAAALISLWAVAAAHAARSDAPSARGDAQAGSPPPVTRSTWDRVYSDEQAKRGAGVYALRCTHCHGEQLAGNGEEATPLAGPAFLSAWDGSTLGALFSRIRTTMPDDNPGTLGGQEIADVMAYVLSVNKFPAGQAELPHDSVQLQQIRFQASKSYPVGRAQDGR